MMISVHWRALTRKGSLILFLINFLLFSSPLILHAAETKYFIQYYCDSAGVVDIRIGSYEIEQLEQPEWDFDNLIFLPSYAGTIWNIDNIEAYESENIRYDLLYYGYAKLADESIAPEQELEAEEHAKQNYLGIWNKDENDGEGTPVSESEPQTEVSLPEESAGTDTGEETEGLYQKMRGVLHAIGTWFGANYQWVLSLGIVPVVLTAFQKRFRTRKRKIFLGGWKGSGKTTFKLLLMNPDASLEELMKQSPTLAVDRQRVIRDESNNKIVLDAEVIDPPGMELQHVLNALVKTGKNRRKKSVVVLMLSPTAGKDAGQKIDRRYIEEQRATLEKLWVPVLLSDVVIKLHAVVLFINKSDLFENEQEALLELFAEHTRLIKSACAGKGIRFERISGSIVHKVGITQLLNIIRES